MTLPTQQTLLDFQGASPAFCSPLLKYAGAKNWLAKLSAIRLHQHLVKVNGVYVEPFFGSGAMGLAIGWPTSIYADTGVDVVNLHRAVVDDDDAVADAVDALRATTGESSYYQIRESIWPENREKLSAAVLAARMIWLNKNGYNGLSRYSQKTGHFNVPWGNRENVKLPSREHIAQVGRALNGAQVHRLDFAYVLDDVLKWYDHKRLVIYLDPPYGARMKNVSPRGPEARPQLASGKPSGVFTGYAGAFTWADQLRVAAWAQALANRGALVMVSNAWSDEILDLYRDNFALFQFGVQHSVGATGARRGKRAEMLAVSEVHAGVVDSVPVSIARKR